MSTNGGRLSLLPRLRRLDTRQRILVYVSAFVVLTLAYTLAYYVGVRVFEGRETSLVRSLEFVVESFTTTGYGSEAPWSSPAMVLLVIAVQFTGILLIFTTLPLFVVPLITDALEESVPQSVALDDHVVVCNYTPRGETIIEEFRKRDVGYVVVESDVDEARDLHDRGVSVIHGDPETTEALENASVGDASAVVVDSTDEENASIVLSAREVSDEVRITSLVEDTETADHLRYAGADEVLLPRRLLGRSIADRATTAVRTELGDAIEIGEDFSIIEMPVSRDSDLCNRSLSDSRIRERSGASVLGLWDDGDFVGSPDSEAVIDESCVLLVAGTKEQLEGLKGMALPEDDPSRNGDVVVAGYGEVGSTVEEAIESTRVDTYSVTVVDTHDREGVDVVGDATDEEVLREAGVEDARALIVALADDTDAVFTTLVGRELNPEMEIIVRVNDTDSIGKTYRAGADYVLALPNVSGRMLALDVLGEDVMTVDKQVKMVRTEAPGLEGRSLADAHVGAETGCIVVAVERDGEIVTDLDPGFVVEEGDTVIVAGSDDDINEFDSEFVDV